MTVGTTSERPVRMATDVDLVSVMNVLDGADLAVSKPTIERRIAADSVLVATSSNGTVLGSLVAIPRPRGVHVEAIAVRPGRRGQGIGSALLTEAGERWGRLTATFDPAVSDFYVQADFEVWSTGRRCFGERPDPAKPR